MDTTAPAQGHLNTDIIHDYSAGRPPLPPGQSISTRTFNSVGGNMTQIQVASYGESGIVPREFSTLTCSTFAGLDILYRYIAMGAVHDSGERFAEPACHPGTRETIMEQLVAWSNDTRPDSTILWLHGSAGMGKSAIAQMFAGECKAQDRLGASFFFKRGHPERGTWHRLITTIAYQLALAVPGLRLQVQHAVEINKLVVGQALKLQFQKLIVEPLQQAPELEMNPVLILDGLDECEDWELQQDILRLFIDGVRVHNLPVRILIASRPEPHIREVLQMTGMFAICRHLELSADERAYEDIRTYLRDKFSKIHSEYSTRGIDLGAVRPAQQVLDHLVKKSSGIFIYAATIIRFVSDQYSHPQEQLDLVLSLDPETTAPLDDLYIQILSVVKQKDRQLRILHVIWQMAPELGVSAGPEEIDLLLDLPAGTSRLALRPLHSLLDVPPPSVTRSRLREPLDVLHTSFTDFLGDPRRSKGWCVSLSWLQSDYLRSMIRLLSSPPSGDSAAVYHR